MSFTRVLLGLLGIAALVAGFLHLRDPGMDTPGEAVGHAIATIDQRAWNARGPTTAEIARPAGIESGGGAPDNPLITLIAAKGGTCAAIVLVEALDGPSGLFVVTCRSASGGSTRYRVDTRGEAVTAIVA